MNLFAWIARVVFRRRPEVAPTWKRYEKTGTFYREMSAEELAADDRERLARRRAQRTPPVWLRRREPR